MYSTTAPAISSPRAFLNAFKTRRRVDLHDLRAFRALEHVDAGNSQAKNLCGAHGRLTILVAQLDRFCDAATVHVAAELLPLRDASHRGDDSIANDECADILALALGDKFLNQHVLFLALQQFDN